MHSTVRYVEMTLLIVRLLIEFYRGRDVDESRFIRECENTIISRLGTSKVIVMNAIKSFIYENYFKEYLSQAPVSIF